MTNEKTAIGPALLVPLLIMGPIGTGFLNNPHFVTEVMGHNAYLAFPLALLFLFPALAFIYLLARRFPGQTLIEQGKSILGPVFGTFTGAVYLGFVLFYLSTFNREVINFINMYYLYTTPLSMLALIYLLASIWLATKGIETLARTASMVFIPGLLILFILLGFGLTNVNLNHLKPVFSSDWRIYVKGGRIALHPFYMLGLSPMVLPFLRPLHSFPKLSAGVLFFLLVFFCGITVGVIGAYGPEYSLHFAYPSQAFLRLIDSPFLIFEQTGMIFGITWIVIVLLASCFLYYSLSLGLTGLISCLNYRKWAWLVAPLVYSLMTYPAGVYQNKINARLIIYFGWIPFFVYPLFLWIMAIIFNKKGVAPSEP